MVCLEDNLLAWIDSQGLFEGIARILPAVSGGADSVAMTFALHRLIGQGRVNAELIIGHVNHGLRGSESDKDEAFVTDFGKRLGVRVAHRGVDVCGFAAANRVSLETAGRVLRLGALAAMARQAGCETVATGHHADDQAETVVHRLMRGTALRGVCGIRPSAMLEGVRFVRPMLGLRRAQIEAYCRAEGLAWREDASNRSCVFTRNRIRNRLMPELNEQLPDAAERLVRLAGVCRAAQERIEAAADAITPRHCGNHAIVYDRAQFVRQSPWVQAELCGRAVQGLGGGLRAVTRRHYQALAAGAAAAVPSTTDWPGGIIAAVENKTIQFSRPTNRAAALPLPCEPAALAIGQATTFGPYRVTTALLSRSAAMTDEALRDKPAMTERLDADCIEGPLTLRRPAPGDRFWPMGLGRAKKAARFLLDAKIEKEQRKHVFVLADTKKILWLAPVRLDERVKITSATQRILEIHFRSIID